MGGNERGWCGDIEVGGWADGWSNREGEGGCNRQAGYRSGQRPQFTHKPFNPPRFSTNYPPRLHRQYMTNVATTSASRRRNEANRLMQQNLRIYGRLQVGGWKEGRDGRDIGRDALAAATALPLSLLITIDVAASG